MKVRFSHLFQKALVDVIDSGVKKSIEAAQN